MSVADADHGRHEIIIVRRGHDDHDEGHHGGVWKIAFADFMTAMMCFFLVMWLINAANEQTKAAVASYFNPVKLVDRESSRKGLQDLGNGPRSVGLMADEPQEATTKAGQDGSGAAGSSNRKQDKQEPQQSQQSDEHLFADPYAVLSEIATETGVMQNVSQKGDGGAQNSGPATGASGGASYRDPFEPDFWSQQVAAPGAEASAQRPRVEGDPLKPGDKAAETQIAKVKAVPPAPPVKDAPLEPLAGDGKDAAATMVKAGDMKAGDAKAGNAKAGDSKAADTPKAVAQQEAAKPEAADKAPTAAAVKAAADVKQQLADAFKPGDKLHDGVSVEATDKGVVISITDQLDFGMFEVGSAVPSRELVLAMEKIGRIVNSQKGTISINGHTDARPFRSANYDNWRLSTARAHSAYYMLVRGGVDERRITEVAGFADRQPKDPADPMSAANRRIEILMATGG
ncbi:MULTISPECIES: MotB family protein [unclassified Mesorhizobium]|uniref:MotB family protein n=1 Tax=unclassified Mesorhizobium TaxID=325217 RepID=UPI000FDC9085|nr:MULTISPECIES: MotB family protein [unclassified Mesorhizobium]TGR48772.1 MotB family protein [bacterium M00.F.Ca.ET.199.01.1.1]TGU37813.1 MotB family protein [bacterium M00.F.Ca.ET.156.01.1.1]TGV88770.1 MotB family protein [Mesorhizobium sp. M00.F.Ca.ET.149.01.1.1]TGR30460.1 MotB family protein [Mesorhizobium sp. M8A.F.Ca.ET.202.01.1.1]TGR31188.1 MotB family protein [Mesorhizobium sp. M8A.F.Ca.ET.197.01.1.1]